MIINDTSLHLSSFFHLDMPLMDGRGEKLQLVSHVRLNLSFVFFFTLLKWSWTWTLARGPSFERRRKENGEKRTISTVGWVKLTLVSALFFLSLLLDSNIWKNYTKKCCFALGSKLICHGNFNVHCHSKISFSMPQAKMKGSELTLARKARDAQLKKHQSTINMT